MKSALHAAAGFETLLAEPPERTPYDYQSIFQPQGMLGKRREKDRLALLRALDGKITELLEDGETVRMVSRGLENSIIEQMFFGWAVYYLNLTAFVLTNRRLLLLQISSRKKPKTFIKQYRLESIRRATMNWGGSLKVTGGDGKTTAFARLPGKDGKRLAALLQEAISENRTRWSQDGKENVCPGCHSAMKGVPPACAECGQAFKSPRRAGALSLVFPGLGDLYIGHYGFAALEILGAGFFWLALTGAMLDPSDGQALSAGAAFMASAMVLVPFVHIPDAIITWRIAAKGLTPASSSKAAASLDSGVKPASWSS